MIINKIDNYYLIKIPFANTNIYDPIVLEDITKKIIKRIDTKNKLYNSIKLTFYQNNKYGIIIKLTDYKSQFKTNNEKTVKISIHPNALFLYQIDYFDIDKYNIQKNKVYYYKNKFYLELNDNINEKDYYRLLELSEIIYNDTELIQDKGIKI